MSQYFHTRYDILMTSWAASLASLALEFMPSSLLGSIGCGKSNTPRSGQVSKCYSCEPRVPWESNTFTFLELFLSMIALDLYSGPEKQMLLSSFDR